MARNVTSSTFCHIYSLLGFAALDAGHDTYIVINATNVGRYRYRQSTRCEGGRKRTKGEYPGPVGGVPENE